MSMTGRLISIAWGAFFSAACGSVAAAPPSEDVLRVAVHLGAVRDASRADIEASLDIMVATEVNQQ